MDFYITVNKNEYGYSSSCPTLKGCYSQGDTEEEAISNIKIAIKEYLQTLQELNNDDNYKTYSRHSQKSLHVFLLGVNL